MFNSLLKIDGLRPYCRIRVELLENFNDGSRHVPSTAAVGRKLNGWLTRLTGCLEEEGSKSRPKLSSSQAEQHREAESQQIRFNLTTTTYPLHHSQPFHLHHTPLTPWSAVECLRLNRFKRSLIQSNARKIFTYKARSSFMGGSPKLTISAYLLYYEEGVMLRGLLIPLKDYEETPYLA